MEGAVCLMSVCVFPSTTSQSHDMGSATRMTIYYVNVGFTALFVAEAIVKIAILTPPVCVPALCVCV